MHLLDDCMVGLHASQKHQSNDGCDQGKSEHAAMSSASSSFRDCCQMLKALTVALQIKATVLTLNWCLTAGCASLMRATIFTETPEAAHTIASS